MTPDAPRRTEVVYPDSDGQPMADNTLQWDWMVKIVGELRELFAGLPVAVCVGPCKADCGNERPGGVVVELHSVDEGEDEWACRFLALESAGVDELYLIDLGAKRVTGFIRRGGRLMSVYRISGWTSPILGVQFGFGTDGTFTVCPAPLLVAD